MSYVALDLYITGKIEVLIKNQHVHYFDFIVIEDKMV